MYPLENENEFCKKFASDVLGHPVKVSLTDGRIIWGSITCLDKRKNLVFSDALEEIEQKYCLPINYKVKFFYTHKPPISNYLKLDEKIL